MYLAIDVGGTKTLLAVFSQDGKILAQINQNTDADYRKFIDSLKSLITNEFKDYQINFCCCGVPGRIDRKNGIGLYFGNLPWRNVNIRQDLGETLQTENVLVENDAKLGALSEAVALGNNYKTVLYLTVSTGISAGVVVDGKLDPTLLNIESGQMLLEHDGVMQKWESFASGKALVKKYGKKASEIDDPAIWQDYTKNLAIGLYEMVANLEPDVVVFGGGVGAYFEKFQTFLEEDLQQINNPLVPIPTLLKAKRPEEAVIYGCYEFIKQHL